MVQRQGWGFGQGEACRHRDHGRPAMRLPRTAAIQHQDRAIRRANIDQGGQCRRIAMLRHHHDAQGLLADRAVARPVAGQPLQHAGLLGHDPFGVCQRPWQLRGGRRGRGCWQLRPVQPGQFQGAA